MQAKERLYRAADGRLVREGDEDGLTLAYTPGDDVLSRDEALLPGTGEEKAAEVPGNKMASRPADKQGHQRR